MRKKFMATRKVDKHNMTNNKQQTAVKWLSEKVLHREWELLTQEKKRKILEQAKEMEIAGKEMSYSDGYAEGYKRALDYISMSIENAKALISTEII
jgi:flagellar biosynthesis/type III secretory pathway protein FliH